MPSSQLGPADNQLKQADNFIIQPESTASYPFRDGYVSPGAFRDMCVDQTAASPNPQCSGFYASYQGPCFAADIAGVAISTTYVARSDVGRVNRRFNPSNAASGGIARAYVRRDQGPGSFVPYDRMTYADNNVATVQGPVATWVFGNANPNAAATNAALRAANPGVASDDLEQNIWAWTPIRNPKTSSARFTC